MMNKEFFENILNTIKEKVSTLKNSKLNVASVILIVIGVICIIVSIYGIGGILAEYKKAVDKYDNLENKYVQINTPDSKQNEGNETEAELAWYEIATVNLAGLQSEYPDVIGWIFFENEDINYPILQGDDTDPYLRATYDGKYATAGSIFIDDSSSSDFSDAHTLVYGHNMKNLSMFGKLKYYKTQEGYYDTHQYFQIFSKNKVMRYQVFSYQEVPVTSFVYTEHHSSARVLANRLSATSMVSTELDIQDSDKIITLSTCTADDEYRFVVSAVLVDTYTFEE